MLSTVFAVCFINILVFVSVLLPVSGLWRACSRRVCAFPDRATPGIEEVQLCLDHPFPWQEWGVMGTVTVIPPVKPGRKLNLFFCFTVIIKVVGWNEGCFLYFLCFFLLFFFSSVFFFFFLSSCCGLPIQKEFSLGVSSMWCVWQSFSVTCFYKVSLACDLGSA